ncbi:alpha-L-rhamnosidase C-terminal domain-containing protein [Paenibacillus sp. 1P07SE]|uniref:alpha-L-rhamnosidase C-terminal domain-containing protein n=1 Tax=Paenibacillus sp. 1P07SE TaxID=3132209 RepID=UPI0039A52152
MKNKLPEWIWSRRLSDDREVELIKTFTLDRPVTKATFHLALTGGAVVYLDGQLAGTMTEQAANVCAFTSVAGFPDMLTAGEHTIRMAIRCEKSMPIASVNVHLAQRTVGCIAFLQGEDYWLGTDETWRTEEGEAAVRVCRLGEEPYGDVEGGPEWFVAGGFGDLRTAELAGAVVMDASGMHVLGRENGMRMEGTAGGDFAIPEPRREELHLFYHVRKQTEWRERAAAVRELPLSGIPTCILDLGCVTNVRFRLRNASDSPVTILWHGSESLPELEHYEGVITEVVQLEGRGEQFTLPQGMRYVRIRMLAEQAQPFAVEWLPEEVVVPLSRVGELTTGLQELERIYEMSVHTNRICHQIGLWDGIKRDRLNWAYDFYLAAKADYLLWDDLSVLRRSIVELGSGTPGDRWMNGIPAYTLWWINNLWEYYLHTGDRSFILSVKEDLRKHALLVTRHIDDQTRAFASEEAGLIEWVPMSQEETRLCMQALLRLTGENMARLRAYLPELADMPAWGWPDIGAEAFLGGEQLITKLLGIMSGYVGEREARACLEQVVLADPITPLSAYWLADCYSAFGMQEQAWQTIRTVWGRMLAEGATACWESVTLSHAGDFHEALTTYTAYGSYRISLCHSWASTPVHWVMSRVLGIRPAEPGYEVVSYDPQPFAGLDHIRGKVPTPYGTIESGWEKGQAPYLKLPAGIRMK